MRTSFNEITVDYNTPRDEFTDAEIETTIFRIAQYFGMSKEKAEDKFGLPYTSSSAFAGLWNTNCEMEFTPGQYIQGFTLDRNDGRIIVLTTDREEADKWYEITT